jgi:hypothetical protein
VIAPVDGRLRPDSGGVESPALRRVLAVVLLALTIVTGAGAAAGRSPIRVTLTAQNHHPRASRSPSVHWRYCVKVTTAAGKSIPSTIQIRIVSGSKVLVRLAVISLRQGYGHWCQALGGEASVWNVVPRGRQLAFQAVVRARGVTVRRSWPIRVHA